VNCITKQLDDYWDSGRIEKESDEELIQRLEYMSLHGEAYGRMTTIREAAKRLSKRKGLE